MSKRRNSLLIAATSIALVAGGLTLATPAYAASDIGGLNITAACQNILGSAWYATTSNASNPWSWRCVKPPVANFSVSLGDQGSMNSVCVSNYGAGAYAVLTYSSAYGWRCYR